MTRRSRTALVLIGTRPEAIKMAPVVHALRANPEVRCVVCASGQHDQLLHEALAAFQITADHDLRVMTANQTLSELTARIVTGMASVLQQFEPALMLVHGDTTTTLSGALSGFYGRIEVGHVEAGLRSGDVASPYPEEMNRMLTDRLSTYRYAPTAAARDNLLREGAAASSIIVTGNTAVDAVLQMRDWVALQPQAYWSQRLFPLPSACFAHDSRLVFITAHRRENFGAPLANICAAIEELALVHADWSFVYSVHPNPNVESVVRARLAGLPNVHLSAPLDYPGCVYLMSRAWLILTDSGGLQEEAPSLGKRVLVLRDKTERHEALTAGMAVLAGTDRRRIVELVESIAAKPAEPELTLPNPYGDGRAAARIAEHVCGVIGATRSDTC